MKESNVKSYSILKQMVKGKDESLALLKAVEKLNVPAEQLQAQHNEKQFIFVVIENQEKQPGETISFEVEKNEENTEQVAIQKAMQYFETFEGNIKKDENETHFLFSKIRG